MTGQPITDPATLRTGSRIALRTGDAPWRRGEQRLEARQLGGWLVHADWWESPFVIDDAILIANYVVDPPLAGAPPGSVIMERLTDGSPARVTIDDPDSTLTLQVTRLDEDFVGVTVEHPDRGAEYTFTVSLSDAVALGTALAAVST